METIWFLIFIGICAFLVVWASFRSKSKTDLAARRAKKLEHPVDNRLAHKEKIWDERRKAAAEGTAPKQSFALKSEGTEPEYDGYSRRDRHHLTSAEHVKKEARIEELDEFAARRSPVEHTGHAT